MARVIRGDKVGSSFATSHSECGGLDHSSSVTFDTVCSVTPSLSVGTNNVNKARSGNSGTRLRGEAGRLSGASIAMRFGHPFVFIVLSGRDSVPLCVKAFANWSLSFG